MFGYYKPDYGEINGVRDERETIKSDNGILMVVRVVLHEVNVSWYYI